MVELFLPEIPTDPMFVEGVMTIQWQEYFRNLTERVGGSDTVSLDDSIISVISGLYSTPQNYGKQIAELEKIIALFPSMPSTKTRGKVTTVTDTYNILNDDETVVCDSLRAFTVTLPDGVVGKILTIKNIGAGTVTLDGYDTDTIDDEETQEIFQYDACKVEYVADNEWSII